MFPRVCPVVPVPQSRAHQVSGSSGTWVQAAEAHHWSTGHGLGSPLDPAEHRPNLTWHETTLESILGLNPPGAPGVRYKNRFTVVVWVPNSVRPTGRFIGRLFPYMIQTDLENALASTQTQQDAAKLSQRSRPETPKPNVSNLLLRHVGY